MKAYKVVIMENRTPKNAVYFSSKNKALGYIFSKMSDDGQFTAIERQEDGRWWDATWCYDTEKMFNSKNWNRYEYVMKSGRLVMYIEAVTIY